MKRDDFFAYRERLPFAREAGLDAATLKAIWDEQDGRCGLTGELLTHETAHLDHILPLVRGGTSAPSNLRWVTESANRAKRDLTDDEFVRLCLNVVEWIG